MKVRMYMMASLMSLAVGCLVADAALHLLPEVTPPFKLHYHITTLFSHFNCSKTHILHHFSCADRSEIFNN